LTITPKTSKFDILPINLPIKGVRFGNFFTDFCRIDLTIGPLSCEKFHRMAAKIVKIWNL